MLSDVFSFIFDKYCVRLLIRQTTNIVLYLDMHSNTWSSIHSTTYTSFHLLQLSRYLNSPNVDRDEELSLLKRVECAYSFSKSTREMFHVQGVWHSPNYLPSNGSRSGFSLPPSPSTSRGLPLLEMCWADALCAWSMAID